MADNIRRATMIARDQRALLRRIANIYPGPGGGMDPSPGGGGYSGPGGGKYIGPSHYADGGPVPPFKLHSGAAKIIGAKGQKKATPQQYAAMPGIKPDELKHSKFDTLGSKALPREEVIKHLEDNAVPLQETVLGDGDFDHDDAKSTKFSDQVLPGGQNYREVLLHLPDAGAEDFQKRHAAAKKAKADTFEHVKNMMDLHGYGDHPELLAAQQAYVDANKDFSKLQGEITERESTRYRFGHWEQPNVLAHVRMSDRRGPNGEKILHLEEAQSDWGQQGRDQGFKGSPLTEQEGARLQELSNAGARDSKHPLHAEWTELGTRFNASRDGLPSGPYVDNTQKWTDLALKRVLHEAAHGGYDKIVVTPGDEQNKRYDLSSQVRNISYFPDIGYLNAETHDGEGLDEHDVKPGDLAKHIGKEAADRILKQELQRHEGRGKLGGEFYHELEGDGLKMGGAGMRGYYDNILPKRPQALAQQHDPQAKVNLFGHGLPSERAHAGVSGADVMTERGIPEHEQDAYWRGLTPQERTDHIEDHRMNGAPTQLHSLDVTPQMRGSIKGNGFNSFKRGGDVGTRQRYADGGGWQRYRDGGKAGVPSVLDARPRKQEAKVLAPEEIRAAYKTLLDPAHMDPANAMEAARVLRNMTIPLGAAKDPERSGYYNIAQPKDVGSVQTTINDIPGLSLAAPNNMTWKQALRGMGKNASVMLLGGDRSRLGRITHIEGKPLAWPVDAHAGPAYMLGPNPDEAWLVGKGAPAARVHKKIGEYAKKGPVFGVYAPMGAQSADSAHNMLDLLLAQIPSSKIPKKTLAEFDKNIREGKHWPGATKDQKEKLKTWPGIANDPKLVSDYVRPENGFSGAHRAAIVKYMDQKAWLKKGFPAVGMTRVALTDPQYLTAPDNTMGGRIVYLDPALSEKALKNPNRFMHSTYQGDPVGGTHYADVDLIQRQFGTPDVTEQLMSKMTSPGAKSRNVPELIHPMSPGSTGRSSYGQMTSLHTPVQPVNQRMAESIDQFYQNREMYPKKAGGRTKYAFGGGIDQLLQNLKGSFSNLNQQVAAQAPQQQQQAMSQQAPYGAYQRMDAQATGQAPSDAYQRMMAQALNGKTEEEMFPTIPKVAAPAPAVAPPPAAAEAMPYYQTNYGPSPTEILGGDGSSSGAADGGGGTGGAGAAGADGSGGDGGASSSGGGSAYRYGGQTIFRRNGVKKSNIVERALAVTRRK
jgi:hypothetical protein